MSCCRQLPNVQASKLRDELASLKQEHAVLAADFEQARALEP